MRNRISFLGIFVLFILLIASCNGNKSKTKTEDLQTVAEGSGQSLSIDTVNSMIKWKGFKVGGEHFGILSLKSGEVTISGDTIVAGRFVIDMNSINAQDLSEPSAKKQLEDHLESADFFDVAQYPESTFEITSAEKTSSDTLSYRISGNLTLKGVTRNLSFDSKVSKDANGYKAMTVPFVINRTDWGVNYGSKSVLGKLKDNIISDDIELEIIIVTNAL